MIDRGGRADRKAGLARVAKQRKETIDTAKQSNRQDVLSQATEELAILNAYLPQPLSASPSAAPLRNSLRLTG